MRSAQIPWRPALAFLLALSLGGCLTELIKPETARHYEPLDALQTVARILPSHRYAALNNGAVTGQGCGRRKGVSLGLADGGGITFTCDGAGVGRVTWSAVQSVQAQIQPNINESTCDLWTQDAAGKIPLYIEIPPDEATCREFGEAMLALTKLGPTPFLAEPSFDAVVANYRAANPKPVPGEDVRRFSVQAENAVRNKDLIAAARAYGEALKLAPWWPQGRYNRALIMGELGFHPEAIQEMQRYLALVPDAANARQAQDKIYGWEAQPKR